MTSSVLRTSSPTGEDSALGVLCAKDLCVDLKWLMQKASPLGEVGGVGFRLQAKVNGLRELQLASGEELSALMPSILDKAFKGEL